MHPFNWHKPTFVDDNNWQFSISLLSITFLFKQKSIFSRKTFSVSSKITVKLTLTNVLTGLRLVLDPYKDLYRVRTQTGTREKLLESCTHGPRSSQASQDPSWLGNGAGSPSRLAHKEGVKTVLKDGLFLAWNWDVSQRRCKFIQSLLRICVRR